MGLWRNAPPHAQYSPYCSVTVRDSERMTGTTDIP
jgi:hypothetical protein